VKRIGLFLATNLAVVLVLSVTLRVLGVEPYLNEQGLNLNALLIFAAVFGFGGAFISLALSKWTAKRAVGAQVITQPRTPTEQWLVQTVARQAQSAGIRMPEVAVYDSPEVNAFATGMSRNASLIAVSTGLLEQMSREEAEAVLGHEVSHVANGDMVTMALIQGVVNTFVMFLSRVIGHVVDRAVFRTESGHGPAFFVTMIIAELLLGILASIIVLWFSRQREFRADRQHMVAALRRLASLQPAPLPDKMAAFGISGTTRGGLMRLFRTHPPLEERIAALENADKKRAGVKMKADAR
jgi:heat shock protein HtpX